MDVPQQERRARPVRANDNLKAADGRRHPDEPVPRPPSGSAGLSCCCPGRVPRAVPGGPCHARLGHGRLGWHQAPIPAWDAFWDLLAGASGRPLAWVTALPEEDFEKLASFALAINAELWDPDKGGGAEGDDLTWASITQRLITFGHAWDSIQDLTLSQMRAFLEESIRQEREQLARDITAASFSMADTNSVQKATRELRRV